MDMFCAVKTQIKFFLAAVCAEIGWKSYLSKVDKG